MLEFGEENLVSNVSALVQAARGIASYPELLNDCQSQDTNRALAASKALLAVAESTQVRGVARILFGSRSLPFSLCVPADRHQEF